MLAGLFSPYGSFMKNSKKKFDVRRMVTMALFCALAYVTVFTLRIANIGGFLTFDVKDTVITIAAMLFGPFSGAIIALVVSLLEMVTISGTGPWGFLMNFVSSAVFAGCASAVYSYAPRLRRRMSGAVAGLGCSVIAMAAVMLLMNLLVTPIYYGVPLETVKGMLLPLILPFNLIKALLNSALVMVLYKPVSAALHRTRLVAPEEGRDSSYHFGVRGAVALACSLAVAVGCVILLVVVLGGQITWN